MSRRNLARFDRVTAGIFQKDVSMSQNTALQPVVFAAVLEFKRKFLIRLSAGAAALKTMILLIDYRNVMCLSGNCQN